MRLAIQLWKISRSIPRAYSHPNHFILTSPFSENHFCCLLYWYVLILFPWSALRTADWLLINSRPGALYRRLGPVISKGRHYCSASRNQRLHRPARTSSDGRYVITSLRLRLSCCGKLSSYWCDLIDTADENNCDKK